jgi:rhamnosyltransferase
LAIERIAMTTLGALIVLFEPSDAELARVAALADACDVLAIVDNATHPDPRLARFVQPAQDGQGLQHKPRAHVVLLHKGNRYGCAAAFNFGLVALFARGCDAVALFDQQCKVPEQYFPQMRALCERMGTRTFLAGPRVFDEVTHSYKVEVTTDGIAVRRLKVRSDTPLQRCAFLSSWGCLVSRAAYTWLGGFDERLFADHIDTEYSLRAYARSVPLYLVPALELSRGAEHARAVQRTGPGGAVGLPDGAWPQRYYSARNAIHLSLTYGLRFPVALATNRHITSQIAHILLHEQDKFARLVDIASGVVDGLLCRLGPLETARPRLAARRAHLT